TSRPVPTTSCGGSACCSACCPPSSICRSSRSRWRGWRRPERASSGGRNDDRRPRFAHMTNQFHPSVPIPKFASLRGTLVCELRNQRDTSNLLILVRFLDLKFLNKRAAIIIGTSNPPHYEARSVAI